MGLFFKIQKSKNYVNFTKTYFLKNEAACACVNMRKYIPWQVSIVLYNVFK